MHGFLPISVLALAGSVLASPVVVYETKVVTVMYTEGAAAPAAPTPAAAKAQDYRPHHQWSQRPSAPPAAPTSAAPATSVVTYAPVLPPSSSAVAVPVTSTEQPATSSAAYTAPAAPSASAPASGSGGDYMSVIDEWRTKMGMEKIARNETLESNVLACLQASPGQMVHVLNAGSYGQVLAPGSLTDDFQHVFVGGWLCEVATTAGLDGICATESNGWDYHDAEGKLQTGHNEILTDPKYTMIGCNVFDGIVGCDVSY